METSKSSNTSMSSFIGLVVIVLILAAMSFSGYLIRNLFTGDLVGADTPPLQVTEWITPNPPTAADLQGKTYVLEFWATWCPPCKQSIPHMIELTKKYKEKGVTFIGLSTDKKSAPVHKMVKDMGINYNIGMHNGLAEKYRVEGIPAAFIINSNNKIAWKGHPLDPKFESAIKNALTPATGE